jgi:penicillin-binding protein 1A
MQMAAGYAVFANGGLRVDPSLVIRVTDADDKVLAETPPVAATESMRAIPERNAFVMRSLLHSVMSGGTGRKAWQQLQRRDDVYGKTGTTNDSFDAWFAGFQPTRVGIAWIGYDTPRQLGERGETGGSVALPVWSGYMQAVLKGVPVAPATPVPAGVLQAEGEWFYDEFAPGAPNGAGVATLGVDAAYRPADVQAQAPGDATPQERSVILDLFR